MRKIALLSFLFFLSTSAGWAEDVGQPFKVTVENYARAETHYNMSNYVRQGAFGKFLHFRNIMDVEKQNVIRMNFDALYSFAVFDLTTPVSIYLPDPSARFQSLMCISEDHSIPPTMYGPGYYTISQEMMKSRYAFCALRTFANPGDANDLTAAQKLQDDVVVKQENKGIFQLPEWDLGSLETMRKLLVEVAKTKPDFASAFGEKDKLNPIDWLLGTAYGWGGNPKEAAIANNFVPAEDDAETPHVLTIPKDVPVDGFWSITLYDGQGYAPKNRLGIYSYNNITAKPNADGSYTITFGAEGPNRFDLVPGWNYIVRLYRPREEVINGRWQFPKPVPVK